MKIQSDQKNLDFKKINSEIISQDSIQGVDFQNKSEFQNNQNFFQDFDLQNVKDFIMHQNDKKKLLQEIQNYKKQQQYNLRQEFYLNKSLLQKWLRVKIQIITISILFCSFKKFHFQKEFTNISLNLTHSNQRERKIQHQFQQSLQNKKQIKFQQKQKKQRNKILSTLDSIFLLVIDFYFKYMIALFMTKKYPDSRILVTDIVFCSLIAIRFFDTSIIKDLKFQIRLLYFAKIELNELSKIVKKLSIYIFSIIPWFNLLNLIQNNVGYNTYIIFWSINWIKIFVCNLLFNDRNYQNLLFGGIHNQRFYQFICIFLHTFQLIHFFSCVFYSLSAIRDFEDGTFYQANFEHIYQRYDFYAYISSFYWMVQTWCTAGYGDLTNSQPQKEYLIQIVFIIIGVILYTYFLSELSSFFVQSDTKDSILMSKISMIEQICKQFNVGQQTQSNIIAKIQQNSNQIFIYNFENVNTLSNHLPKSMVNQVLIKFYNYKILNSCYPQLKNNIFFQDSSQELLKRIALNIYPLNFQKNEIIYEKDRFSNYIYFILQGKVYCSIHKQVAFQYYVENSYFGDIEILLHTIHENICYRLFSVISFDSTQLFLISKQTILTVLDYFPIKKNQLLEISFQRYQKSIAQMKQILDLQQISPHSDFWQKEDENFFIKVKQRQLGSYIYHRSSLQQSKTQKYKTLIKNQSNKLSPLKKRYESQTQVYIQRKLRPKLVIEENQNEYQNQQQKNLQTQIQQFEEIKNQVQQSENILNQIRKKINIH